MKSIRSRLLSSMILCFLIFNLFIVENINSKTDDIENKTTQSANYNNNDPLFPQHPNFQMSPFNSFVTNTPISINYEDYYNYDSKNIKASPPQKQELRVYRTSSITSDKPEIMRSLYDPQTDEVFYRGDTITVEGNLKGFAIGEYWNGEDVDLFYNVTESQYEANPTFYIGNPNYYVSTFHGTYDQGNFSFSFDTSTLNTAPFSNVGEITLFTWFDGNPLLSRANGTAGYVVVKIYGRLKLDVDESVTNPGATYTYTTRILYDNNSVVNTQGTEYDLTVFWSIDDFHVNGVNYTFDATHQHIYSNTAPVVVQTVTYTAYYDMTPLSFNFFTIENPSNPDTDRLLYTSFSNQTEEQVVVDAYFVVGITKTKTPIEIALDSSFTIYANLSNEISLQPSKTIQITYTIGTISTTEYRVTDGSGEIQFIKTLPYANVTDITKTFSIQFTALSAEFPGSMITPDSLTANMAVNITTIEITIDDNTIFYTVGQAIDYTVTIRDEFNRIAPFADFNLEFPGLASQNRTVGGAGVWDGADTLLSVLVAPNKMINVSAINKSSLNYRYVVPSTVLDNDTFSMYFVLTLTLTNPSGGNVLDGSTWTELNTTFWNLFNIGNYYNLSAVDQWGRKPIGATISISLAGRTNFTIVSDSQNYVLFDLADLFLTATPQLLSTHAFPGLSLFATGGSYAPAPSISQTINIYGPDNNAPSISGIVLNPIPDDPGAHVPYYNITITITATDIGTGIRTVLIHYQLYEPDGTPNIIGNVTCFNIGGNFYQGTVNMTYAQSQYYVVYYIEAIDYAGYGLDQFGARQIVPVYDGAFGWNDLSDVDWYQVGDITPPIEEQGPNVVLSPDPFNPYANITVYVNDSLVWTGMLGVWLVVNRTNLVTLELEIDYVVALMTYNTGTNEWFYQLTLGYNYNYTWYYIAADSASPFPNVYYSYVDRILELSSIDSGAPSITGLDVNYLGSVVLPDSVLNFTVTVTDLLVEIDIVILLITYNGESFNLPMVKQGATDDYAATFNLADYPLDTYGNFSLVYNVEANDTVGNRGSLGFSLNVYNAAPPRPPGFSGNLGGILGGVVGGIVALIAVLFLWFNRHTLQTYAKKQTFRRRLRDYLREIIEDIKKDGLEGRYKEGLLKTWAVVEGIGREFFELPRYRSQTPMEFSRLLAQKGKIERELLLTLLEYFEKARYGYEEITENDFNSGVRALLKIVDKIEVGEMKIES